MLSLHAGMRVHLALGATDMRRGFDGLAAQVHPIIRIGELAPWNLRPDTA